MEISATAARPAADVGVVGEGAESERVVRLPFPRILSSSGDRPVILLGGSGRLAPICNDDLSVVGDSPKPELENSAQLEERGPPTVDAPLSNEDEGERWR